MNTKIRPRLTKYLCQIHDIQATKRGESGLNTRRNFTARRSTFRRVFSKPANPLSLLQTSATRVLFRAKSVDSQTYSFLSCWSLLIPASINHRMQNEQDERSSCVQKLCCNLKEILTPTPIFHDLSPIYFREFVSTLQLPVNLRKKKNRQTSYGKILYTRLGALSVKFGQCTWLWEDRINAYLA